MSWMDRTIRPMLAHKAEPFDSEDFVFEPKFDGTRAIAFVGERTRLQNRRLLNITYRYPELEFSGQIDAKEAVLDGEIVVLQDGKPNFRALQTREHTDKELRIGFLSKRMPATYMVFDLLYLDGRPIVDRPLLERREKLREIVTEGSNLLLVEYAEEYGRRYFEEVIKRGVEGAMAKRRSSTYQIGRRSRDWLKLKNVRTMDCVILGYTLGEGWRSRYFGALVLGAYRDGKLVYVGRVGTGFDEESLGWLTDLLKSRETREKPIDLVKPYVIKWVKPELVCEVEFMELTPDLKLRAPSFKRIRTDKGPEECILEARPKRELGAG